MSETSGRLLSLLSLLQTPREWPGPELADRLQRDDPHRAQRRRAAAVPGLPRRGHARARSAATSWSPARPCRRCSSRTRRRWRWRSRSVRRAAARSAGWRRAPCAPSPSSSRCCPSGSATASTRCSPTRPAWRRTRRGRRVDGALLTAGRGAARDRELVRFDYSDRSGQGSERKVEPYRLVNWGRRWYLVAFDPQRDDWRTFRVDRLKETRSTGHRFRLRDLPADDVATWVASKIRAVQQQANGKVLVRLPAQDVVARLGPWLEGGGVEPRGDDELPADDGRADPRRPGLLDRDPRRRLRGRRLARARRRRRAARRPLRQGRGMTAPTWPAVNARRLAQHGLDGCLPRRHRSGPGGGRDERRARPDPVGGRDLRGAAGRGRDARRRTSCALGGPDAREDLRPARHRAPAARSRPRPVDDGPRRDPVAQRVPRGRAA